MGDFTKEELETILDYIDNDMSLYRMDDAEYLCVLQKKIQSMIDDYPKCDHRSGLHNYNEKGECVGYPTDIYRCRHCDILFKFIFKNGECIGHEDLE